MYLLPSCGCVALIIYSIYIENEKQSKLEWSTNCGVWNPWTLWRWVFTPVLIHKHKHRRATFWGGKQYSGSNSPWRKQAEKRQPFFLSAKLIAPIFSFQRWKLLTKRLQLGRFPNTGQALSMTCSQMLTTLGYMFLQISMWHSKQQWSVLAFSL